MSGCQGVRNTLLINTPNSNTRIQHLTLLTADNYIQKKICLYSVIIGLDAVKVLFIGVRVSVRVSGFRS